jgi:hypothetical protein
MSVHALPHDPIGQGFLSRHLLATRLFGRQARIDLHLKPDVDGPSVTEIDTLTGPNISIAAQHFTHTQNNMDAQQ